MKGILIIGFSKVTGSYIDVQYPENIHRKLEVKPSILLSLLEENREKNVTPNFSQMVIKKDLSAAYFYTGSLNERFVGRPDYVIVVLMAEDEILPKNIEGMIRRLAHELLPQRGKLTFNALFADYFELLRKAELGPYWKESIQREGDEIESVLVNGKEMESTELKAPEPPFTKETDTETKSKNQAKAAHEVSNIDEEINDLKQELVEKNEKIENWGAEFADLNENNANLMKKIKDLNEKINQQAQEIESKTEDMENFKEEIKKHSEQAQELEKRDKEINELKECLEDASSLPKEIDEKSQEINDLKNNIENLSNEKAELETRLIEFDEKKKEIDKINTENDNLNQILENLKKDFDEMKNSTENSKSEKESFLDTITGLKLDLKKAREQLKDEQDNQAKIKEDFIDMKKEIKVLRRERDHYQKIVKDKDLL